MNKCSIVLILLLGCSTNPVSTNNDRRDIEKISEAITSEHIDSILISRSDATVYFKGDTIDSFRVRYPYLRVFHKEFIESAEYLRPTNQVSEGNWISGKSLYHNSYTIDLTRDSIPFIATTYDTFSINSLKNFLKYLTDSTICGNFGCVDMPIDSIRTLAWHEDNDTNIINISRQTSRYEGISYLFKYLNGVIVNWSTSMWIV
jgi:hypothetical protein